MSNFKEFERKAWEQKAERYDTTWGRVSSQSIASILELAGGLKGKSLLDLGCGPGHLCQKAALAGAKVTGCDYSQRMLEIARRNYPEISFCHEDAEALHFSEGQFDVVTMNYLLLHVANQEKALSEARRVLSNNGKLIFSMWIPPEHSPGLGLIFSAIKQFADMSVIPPAQDIFTFSDAEHCRSYLENNGFANVESREIQTRWEVASPDDFFEAVQAGTRMGGLIDLQAPDIKEKIKANIFSRIESFQKDGRYVVPTPSLVVAAVKA